MTLGIVVVSYGSADLLRANLARLALDGGPARVVVVENFRSQGQTEAVRALARQHGWLLVENDTNTGFGAATNQGVAVARTLGCNTYLLLNPDVAIDGPTVDALAAHCGEHPNTLASPRIIRADGSTWFAGATVQVRAGRTSTAAGADSSASGGWLTGACLAVHDQLWSTIGGFDEDFFLYWEDVDLSWRCVSAGGRLAVLDQLQVIHAVGATQRPSGRLPLAEHAKSPGYVYYNCRNRMLFAVKHLTRRDVLRWALRGPGYARRVLLRGGRRALLGNLLPLTWAALRGTVAGTARAAWTLLIRCDGPLSQPPTRPLAG